MMPGMPPMPGLPGPGPTMPAAVPTNNQGSRTEGLVLASLMVKLGERAIPILGATSKEGQELLKFLGSFGKLISPPNSDVTSQELKLMGAEAPAVPNGPGNVVDINARLQKYGLSGGVAA